MIKSLNLALSNRCTARCVYCPDERGKRDSGVISEALVQNLMEEVTDKEFPWKIQTVQLGENGDALLNPKFPEIVSLIRECLPSARLDLTTNMVYMKATWSRYLLKRRILNSIGLNIDGHDAISYEAQKDLDYKRVMDNFRMLMDCRKQHQPNLQIVVNVLTLRDYYDKVIRRFGCFPIKTPSIIPETSFELVEEGLRKLEWVTDDVYIRRSPMFFWAERGLPLDFDLSQYACPQLPRIEQEAFISPSGLWYPCCLDANQDQAYGNVAAMGLMEIHESPARLDFIQKLKDRKFNEIGYPCSRVAFCGAIK